MPDEREKLYRPLPDYLKVKDSKIEGSGIFTKVRLKKGLKIGMTHLLVEDQIFRSPLGGFLNHSFKSNCVKKKTGNKYYLYTKQNIPEIIAILRSRNTKNDESWIYKHVAMLI